MKDKLTLFFEYIDKHRADIVNCSKGKLFEDNLINCLKKQGLSFYGETQIKEDLLLHNYILEIKEAILDKNSEVVFKNELFLRTNQNEYTDFFVAQPYGSQNYPDFLVFTRNNIFPIESKFSTKAATHPVWNSNLPKANGIYVFGSYQKKDVTYFLGSDVLPSNERKLILSIWNKTDNVMRLWTKDIHEKIESGEIKNEYGFRPYIRKAYEQKKVKNSNAITDFFKNVNRDILESNVKNYIIQEENSLEAIAIS